MEKALNSKYWYSNYNFKDWFDFKLQKNNEKGRKDIDNMYNWTYFVTLLSWRSNLDANYVMEEKFIDYRKNKENRRKNCTIHVYYLSN